MTKCIKCNHQIEKKICPICGQSAKVQRIDRHYISHEIKHHLNIEKGFLYTIKELLIRPGKAIREYILEDRDKYIKPIVFLVSTAVIFALITYLFHIKYSYFNINNIQGLKEIVNTGDFGEWLNNNIEYTNLTMGCFIALWIMIFFRKVGYNFYEILVLLCFVMGEATLILSFSILLVELTNSSIFFLGTTFFCFSYLIWAVGQFFGEKKLLNYIKSLMAFILGSISYLITLILIGFIMGLF